MQKIDLVNVNDLGPKKHLLVVPAADFADADGEDAVFDLTLRGYVMTAHIDGAYRDNSKRMLAVWLYACNDSGYTSPFMYHEKVSYPFESKASLAATLGDAMRKVLLASVGHSLHMNGTQVPEPKVSDANQRANALADKVQGLEDENKRLTRERDAIELRMRRMGGK